MTPISQISPVFNKISTPIYSNQWNTQNKIQKKTKTNLVDLTRKLPWLKSKAIKMAIAELHDLKFDEKDINYLKAIGVNVPFKSGEDAVHFLENQNIRIIFDKTTEKSIHAQYDFMRNIITINDIYKNTKDFSVILAISEAILHETGHAKDNDGDSSIQEELDFLGMNAIAHRAYLKKYDNIFQDSKEPIVADGVSIYEKLFFEPDPDKKNLIERVQTKYGDLPAGDIMHPPSKLARSIKQAYEKSNENLVKNVTKYS